MTIMQFLSSPNDGKVMDTLYDLSLVCKDDKRLELPPEYCQFKELPFETGSALYAPVCTINIDLPKCDEYKREKLKEISWLQQVSGKNQECFSWSKYHSGSVPSSKPLIPGKNALMPLLREKVATLVA